MPRNEKILTAIDPALQSGIEIGPLANPVVTKTMGDIAYVDRASTAELRKWFGNDPSIDTDRIVDVDYVWGASTFEEIFERGKKFDYVIACHVIEHVPDMIGWFKEAGRVLKPNGVISLVIPDKRYTLDRLRRVSSGAELIGAYLCKLRKPSPRQIFDHFSLVVEADAQTIWSGACDELRLKKMYETELALDACRDSVDCNKYIDSHCWVFTPDSFFRNLTLLMKVDLFDFEVINFTDTAFGENEFFVSLRKTGDVQDGLAKRKRQLNSIPKSGTAPTSEGLQQELENCFNRLEQQERIITAIMQSTTWKMTAPIRNAIEKLKSLLRRDR